jgi:site-specific DNA-methyltransferase (adenine-specific)
VFGKSNFRNEIVWCYRGVAVANNYFPKKTDTIFLYTKSDKYTFNIIYDPHTDAQLKRYNIIKKDGSRWANMKGKIRKLGEGVRAMNWWYIPQLSNNAKERTGYPTQKPLALLYRIIKASSQAGDVVFDPFCGCATACVAAQQLQRHWIGIDIEKQAAGVLVERLSDDAGLFKDFIHRVDIPKRDDVTEELPNQNIKEKLFKAQQGHCNGCDNEYLIKDFHIDHIVPKSKGGGNYYENYQLLCGHCNTTKGDRPMEYLMTKTNKRDELLKSKLTFGKKI